MKSLTAAMPIMQLQHHLVLMIKTALQKDCL